MNISRVLAVSKRVFTDLKNDRRTLALIIVAPLFAMAVFGLAFSGDISDVDMIIVNEDAGAQTPMGQIFVSEMVISNIDPDTVEITHMENLSMAVESVENGDAYAVIYFPEGFSNFSQASTSIQIYIDKSNVNVAESIITTVNEALLATMEDANQQPPISVEPVPVFGQDAEFMDFFVPGIMAFVVYILTTLLTLITFVGERVSGTLTRILTTPLKESEIVMGYALTFSIVGTLQAALLLSVGMLVFDVTIVGNVGLAFLVVALLAIVCQALGILLSSLTQREAQAIQMIPFIIIPGFLLSGVFWPIEAIPVWLRPASYLVPPSYAIDATRSVMLRGWGLDMIWHDIAALIIFALVFLALATWSLKRKK